MKKTDWEKIIKIKADLLCMGMHSSKAAADIYLKQNPCEDRKTGNIGIHLSIEGVSNVLATVSHSFDKKSPYSIEYNKDGIGLDLFKNGKIVCRAQEVAMPNWYDETTKTGLKMPSIFLHEGRSFLHQTYLGCDYFATGGQCKFCGAGAKWKIGKPEEIGETVGTVVKENNNYQVCLGGGNRLPVSRNIEYFLECVFEIRKRNYQVPIWIEMVPPDNDEDIEKLVKAGVTSFGFNIEIWDDKLRNEICPAKSKNSKNRYFSAMGKALSLLGKNRVGTCLIAGLEPISSSIEGAAAFAAIGVQTCVLPFKPWDNSFYRDRIPCDPETLIKISERAVDSMIENGVSPLESQGCLQCDACTIDHDIYIKKTNQ